nr:LuxR C-terminal-related transcriptional regulator [Cereibacter changlensis]
MEEVGRELELQQKAVKHHMTSILQKLQGCNRVEASILARQHLR